MWANGDSRQNDDVIDSLQIRENAGLMNESTSVRGESFFNSNQPKVRPFDVACTSSKLKLKKTNATNYLQTGRMLKYLDSLTDNLSAPTKDTLVTSYRLHPEPLDESNSFTGVDTLTYSEVARHLTTLRTEHVQRFIRPVLQRLLLHPKNVGNLFNKPVDPIALHLPDYFVRIKRPMDLGTVKSRLQRGFYKNMESVTADIHLVFKNALTYNAANHAIHLIAKTMKADFESDLAALEEKCAREMDRKSTHSCTLCQGASCPLCGEKCLKFDPPVLVCHGTCLQRVKKNSVYYVTVDGIMLWCQRCYSGLPHVILEMPNRPPLLKKNLLKRRLDEEVAEPWVSCDICGHWFHHICALYNDRISVSDKGGLAITGGSSTCTTHKGPYECPLCKLESVQRLSNRQTQTHTDGEQEDDMSSDPLSNIFTAKSSGDADIRGSVCDLDETTSDSEMGEGERERAAVMAVSKALRTAGRPLCVTTARAETRSRAGVAKAAVDITSKRVLGATAPSAHTVKLEKGAVHSSEAGRGSERLRPVMESHAAEEEREDCTVPESLTGLCGSDAHAATSVTQSTCDVSERDRDDEMDVSEDSSVVTHAASVTDAPTYPQFLKKAESSSSNSKKRRDRGSECAASDSAADVNTTPAHLNQWRASTLPRSKLSDFLEVMVAERLRSSGYEEAADTVTVRMASNVEQYMELPLTITDNLRAPEGTCLSPLIPYRQKCILMFQKVDGVDVCLFCLYVQEFDERCPAPNSSVVYIAYLDSVDFFRPMEARTLVYQEIMVGYFKWAQMRGFKNGHIWSCPPQRGDNFIFWCHPAHQRTPSRDRLNAWYNSILLRSSKMGILEEVGTLWSAYFSGYGRRESSGRKDKDKDKEETKPSLGAPSCDDDVGSAVTADLCVQLPAPAPVVASSSSSSGRHGKLDSTSAGGEPEDAPVCPPVFEGDFWVTECMRVHRLVMGRSKGCDGQDRGVNQRKCRDLLKDLMSKPSSMPFCRPVDIVKLCIPDYPIVVPEPMDLGTIRDLLRTRYYRSILHFAEAVRLTFRNAMRYNPPGHPINEIARLLSIEFEQSLVDLLSEYIGAVPKAENVNKYLDSYPIADSVPAPGPAGEPLPEEVKKPPLSLGPTPTPTPALDELPRDRTRRRAGITLEIKTETDGDSGLLGNQTPLSMAEGDTDTGTPQLRRADSMDSVASYGSLLNDSTHTGEALDGWTPRLMFASSALSGPIPVPAEGEGGVRREALKPFEKPALGFKGALALMSEIAKSVFRLKDDLFVIKFADPSKRPRAPPLKKKSTTDSENGEIGEREARENDDDSADVSDLRPSRSGITHAAPSSRVKARGVCFSEPVCLPSEVPVDLEGRGDDSLSVTHSDCDLEEQDMTFDLKDTADSIPLKLSIPDSRHMGIESADAEGSEGTIPFEPHSTEDLGAWTLEGGHQDSAAMAMGGAGPVSYSLDSATASTSYDEEGGQEHEEEHEHDTSELESDYVIVPSAASSPRAPSGRRGRDPGRRKTGHHKKSRSPKRRAGKSPASLSEPVPVFDEPPTALTCTSSATAAAAGKLKGGKAGAYLKRMSGERDQACEGDMDRGEAYEEAFSEKCMDLLSQLVPDTSDPDPLLKCAFVDSRHTFLEMCQFRHYQFDTLRRAKHSSLMLLYHLHFPDNLNARPTCACCAGPIRDVRWHCDQCADFDVCDVCYRATETESDANDTQGHPGVRGKPKGKDGAKKLSAPLAALMDPLTAEKHSHPLTPFRITYI